MTTWQSIRRSSTKKGDYISGEFSLVQQRRRGSGDDFSINNNDDNNNDEQQQQPPMMMMERRQSQRTLDDDYNSSGDFLMDALDYDDDDDDDEELTPGAYAVSRTDQLLVRQEPSFMMPNQTWDPTERQQQQQQEQLNDSHAALSIRNEGSGQLFSPTATTALNGHYLEVDERTVHTARSAGTRASNSSRRQQQEPEVFEDDFNDIISHGHGCCPKGKKTFCGHFYWGFESFVLLSGILLTVIMALLIGFLTEHNEEMSSPRKPPSVDNGGGSTDATSSALDFDNACSYVASVLQQQQQQPSAEIMIMPNPLMQCACDNTLDHISDSVTQKYHILIHSQGLQTIPVSGIPMDHCFNSQHLAILWLAWQQEQQEVDSAEDEDDQEIYNRFVLATMFLDFQGAQWRSATNWLSTSTTETTCRWFGVECDDKGRIVGLSLPQNNLQGLASTLFFKKHLPHLRLLNLKEQQHPTQFLWNQIPISLPHLQYLDISGVKIESGRMGDALFSDIPSFQSLQHLNLANTGLAGSIPASLWTLPRLQVLDLSHNAGLVGTLPAGGLGSNVTLLDVSQTSLSGTLPPSLLDGRSVLTKLKFVDVNIEGTLPTEMGLWTSLESLELDFSKIEGTIPTEIGLLTALQVLSLKHSPRLNGTLPIELGQLTDLTSLFLSSNDISGTIPGDALGSLTNLQRLVLGGNPKMGTDGGGNAVVVHNELPFQNMKLLRYLDIAKTQVGGPLKLPCGGGGARSVQVSRECHVECPCCVDNILCEDTTFLNVGGGGRRRRR